MALQVRRLMRLSDKRALILICQHFSLLKESKRKQKDVSIHREDKSCRSLGLSCMFLGVGILQTFGQLKLAILIIHTNHNHEKTNSLYPSKTNAREQLERALRRVRRMTLEDELYLE